MGWLGGFLAGEFHTQVRKDSSLFMFSPSTTPHSGPYGPTGQHTIGSDHTDRVGSRGAAHVTTSVPLPSELGEAQRRKRADAVRKGARAH